VCPSQQQPAVALCVYSDTSNADVSRLSHSGHLAPTEHFDVRPAQTQDPAGRFQQINTNSTRLTHNAGSPRLTVTYSLS